MTTILEEYKNHQIKTQIKNFNIQYLTLGLGGEVGEVQNEIKKLERDDNNILNENRKQQIITELGDVMWYLTGICNKLDITLEEILINNMEKLNK